ncbi:hypothetical protein [Clostridium sp. D33t1_170424_F3]|uniref:hypothetical protein n=1 Tax=Clostridium sp. D33t1_170424_F3 TaxID=2787099 RepID=UPI0018ABDDF1|nr:hypothetical protein [Clostridium sp. D33t1_170424_F3]
MDCPKYGKVNPENCVFCGCCRNALSREENAVTAVPAPLEPQPAAAGIKAAPERAKKQRVGKKWVIGAVVGFLLVGATAAALSLYYRALPASQFKRTLEDGNTAGAVAVFQSYSNDPDFMDRAGRTASEYVDKLIQSYQSREISGESALAGLESVGLIIDTKQYAEQIERIEASRASFEDGKAAMELKDYKKAIVRFSEVLKEDTASYRDAKLYTERCALGWSNQVYAKISQKANQEDYFGAYTAALEIDPLYASEDVKALTAEVREKAAEEVFATAKELFDKQQYAAVYEYIQKFDPSMLTEEISQLADGAASAFAEAKIAEADDIAEEGDLERAAQLLETANGEVPSDKLTEKLKEYGRQQEAGKLSQTQNALSVYYDAEDETYRIAPKGLSTRYINLGKNRNMEPRITADSTGAVFVLLFGLQEEESLYMDEITVDCDGREYPLHVDFYDRNSQLVFGGGVLEWYAAIHTLQSSSLYKRAVNLKPMLEDMLRATEVRIRFSGDRDREILVPAPQIQELQTMWEVFQTLETDPSLVEEFAE